MSLEMESALAPRQSPPSQMPSMPGPPYVPTTAALGGQPTVGLDVPITAVFLLLFVLGAISHMTIFQLNKRRGHKFLMSGAMFGFCMSRIATCTMRLAWATHPTNISVAIAAQILVAAGVIILFIINLIFAQRILRAAHPNSGWHPLVSLSFKILYFVIVGTLFVLIGFTVNTFYTLDPVRRAQAHDITLYGGTLFATIAILPIFLVVFGLLVPRKTRLEKFGSGRFRHKVIILLTASCLLGLGAWFRTGTNYLPPRPQDNPAPYQSKACFYIFNFGVEIVVIWLYILVRVDRRFHIPNGAKGPGSYSGAATLGTTAGNTEGTQDMGKVTTRIMSEEEVFDDVPEAEMDEMEAKKEDSAV